MKKRNNSESPELFCGIVYTPEKIRLGQQVAIGKDRPEGPAGEAGSIDHYGRIVIGNIWHIKSKRPFLNYLSELRSGVKATGSNDMLAERDVLSDFLVSF